MRKVLLKMKEKECYDQIKKLVDTNGNKQRAAVKLGCTIRTINRKIALYKMGGKAAFVHGNRDRVPAITLPQQLKQQIIELYQHKYHDTNFAHFRDLLERFENINITYPTLYKLLKAQDILSPKAQKTTQREFAKRKRNATQPDKTVINGIIVTPQPIVALEDAHPRQERSKYFGEVIQMDASEHIWFGKTKAHLHLAIDNATSHIVGAYFDTQETLHGYYTITKQLIENYGIPYQILTDNRTVFNYEKKGETRLEKQTLTQYGYACKILGIDLNTTSVPQAKGRVERSFGTHQSRLLNELKLQHINSIEEANNYLNKYVIQHNLQFALPYHSIKSVFEKQSKELILDHVLAVITKRVVDSGHCIRFKNKYYATYQHDLLITLRPKTTVLVIEAFSGETYLSCDGVVYHLAEVPMHKKDSEQIDFVEPLKYKKSGQRTPSDNHHWRSKQFDDYTNKSTFYKQAEKYYYSEANVF